MGETSGCQDDTACNWGISEECTYAEEYYDCAGECLADDDGDGVCNELEAQGQGGGASSVNAAGDEGSGGGGAVIAIVAGGGLAGLGGVGYYFYSNAARAAKDMDAMDIDMD